jgi:hypothetical protein
VNNRIGEKTRNYKGELEISLKEDVGPFLAGTLFICK